MAPVYVAGEPWGVIGLEDLELTARSERLPDAVDYVGVARAVRRVVARRHYPLVETLTHAIAQAVLADRMFGHHRAPYCPEVF